MRGVPSAAAPRCSAVQLGAEGGGPVAYARDGLRLGTGDEEYEGGLREHLDGRGVPADPSAVRDDVGGRVRGVGELREGPAERGPQPREPGRLLGVPEPDEHFEPTAQRLYVVPELVRYEATAGGRGDGQHAGVRVQRPAVRGGTAVHEVAAGRVGLGEQHPAGPDGGEGDGRRGDAGGTFVGGEGDEGHGVCDSLRR